MTLEPTPKLDQIEGELDGELTGRPLPRVVQPDHHEDRLAVGFSVNIVRDLDGENLPSLDRPSAEREQPDECRVCAASCRRSVS